MDLKAHLWQIAVAFDQLGNTLLGGHADETVSARAWRNRTYKKRWAVAVHVLDAIARVFGQEGHCKIAYELEVQRRQLPPEYRAT